MSDKYIKNIEFSTVLPLADQVNYQPGQIVSKTLAQNKALSLTLFAFDKDEEISTHESDGDAMVIALDGKAKSPLTAKISSSAPERPSSCPRKPHAVYALEQFKMFLVVVFPPEK